ncbi:polysaccharide deacetylase family protein [Tepidanaerobacter acetatoxydans]|uniref:polysaccharide deacetylase family protein n=1 Tax=Tepidanaerobacter acetatoxydans TaxID=499229 RepID=UPI001BD5FF68
MIWKASFTLKSGFIEFGSHTFNAHYFVKDKKSAFVEMDENELSKDFKDMDSFFEKIGMPKVLSIAYPYGQFNAKIVNGSCQVFLGFLVKKASP